jgi:methylmalonyl-CoA/ethylmalonyl-CoA epimerase
MLERIHHVAFAHAPDAPIHEVLEQALGLIVAHEEVGDGFIERMLPIGDGYIQTLEPTGPGLVQRFVDRRGSALHHVAFSVADVRAVVESLRLAGVPLVEPAPRRGGMGTQIAFIHPSATGGMLVELVEGGTRPDDAT